MFNMMFPKMSSNMMQAVKNGLSNGKPMEMNAPAAGAMNVVNMAQSTAKTGMLAQSKPAGPPQSTATTGMLAKSISPAPKGGTFGGAKSGFMGGKF